MDEKEDCTILHTTGKLLLTECIMVYVIVIFRPSSDLDKFEKY